MNPDRVAEKTKNHFLLKPVKFFMKASLIRKTIIIVITLVITWFGYTTFFGSKKPQANYQTAQAEKGTLIVTVSGSGQASTANNSSITTEASGVVSNVYVKDGDQVKAGDKIAEIDLDLLGQQNASQSLAAYQNAKNNLDSANTNLYTLQSDMFTKWNIYMNIATNGTYQNSDGTPNQTNRTLPEFITSNDNWLAAEAKYKNQQNVVTQAQTALNSAWLSYQQTSSTIYAPISGTVSGLSLQPGSVIATTQNTSNNSNSTQSPTKIATVKTDAYPTVSVNLTEIDIPSVKIGDSVTITFDALTDKTFTGKVISIDTAGVTLSGVTTYPTSIRLDTKNNAIFPSMAITANIITNTKDNVLLVPIASVQTQNGTSYVRVMKNGQIQQVPVETGLSSDTQTEIISGLSEGDTVVTSIIQSTSTNQQSSRSQSPFSSFGGGRSGFGGVVRTGR